MIAHKLHFPGKGVCLPAPSPRMNRREVFNAANFQNGNHGNRRKQHMRCADSRWLMNTEITCLCYMFGTEPFYGWSVCLKSLSIQHWSIFLNRRDSKATLKKKKKLSLASDFLLCSSSKSGLRKPKCAHKCFGPWPCDIQTATWEVNSKAEKTNWQFKGWMWLTCRFCAACSLLLN